MTYGGRVSVNTLQTSVSSVPLSHYHRCHDDDDDDDCDEETGQTASAACDVTRSPVSPIYIHAARCITCELNCVHAACTTHAVGYTLNIIVHYTVSYECSSITQRPVRAPGL